MNINLIGLPNSERYDRFDRDGGHRHKSDQDAKRRGDFYDSTSGSGGRRYMTQPTSSKGASGGVASSDDIFERISQQVLLYKEKVGPSVSEHNYRRQMEGYASGGQETDAYVSHLVDSSVEIDGTWHHRFAINAGRTRALADYWYYDPDDGALQKSVSCPLNEFENRLKIALQG